MRGPDARLRPWAAGLALALVAYAPALIAWDQSGMGDWAQFDHWSEVSRRALLHFSELPLYDPHHCGGVPMWGQPQAQFLAPTWWLTVLPFGAAAGDKLFILLHHVVGFVGMFVMTRRLYRVGDAPAALAAIAWTFGGFFAWRATLGHAGFLAFHYLPWILYCARRAQADLRYAGGVAALMGLSLAEGGNYPFVFASMILALDATFELARGEWRALRAAAIFVPLTLLVGAVRLWPIALTMGRFPRRTDLEGEQSTRDVLEALTAREPHAWQWDHAFIWAEYSAYLGLGVLILAGWGTLVALRRARTLHVPLAALVMAAIAMGDRGPRWPWPRLHALPIFDSLHVEARFHVLLTFYLALLAALALEAARARLAASITTPAVLRATAALSWLLVLAVGVEVVSNTVRIGAHWEGPPIAGTPGARFHLVREADYLERFAAYAQRNVGTDGCYDPVPWEISPALWMGDAPQTRLSPAAAGTVRELGRTNHTVRMHVKLTRPARLVLNQNHDPDWHASVGRVRSDEGRLAIDLPVGVHEVTLRYAPRDLPASPLLTLLGIALCLALTRASPARLARFARGRCEGARAMTAPRRRGRSVLLASSQPSKARARESP